MTIELNLRPGDGIIGRNKFALLYRQTKKYWFYYMEGKSCRIGKASLWRAIDTISSDLSVHAGSSLKYRRKQRKMRTLDLHGVRHGSADDKIRQFLNFVELPCEIITGDSSKMKRIVEIIVKEYEWSCHEKMCALGILVVTEKH